MLYRSPPTLLLLASKFATELLSALHDCQWLERCLDYVDSATVDGKQRCAPQLLRAIEDFDHEVFHLCKLFARDRMKIIDAFAAEGRTDGNADLNVQVLHAHTFAYGLSLIVVSIVRHCKRSKSQPASEPRSILWRRRRKLADRASLQRSDP